MAINIVKKTSLYQDQNFVDFQTVLTQANMEAIDNGLLKVSSDSQNAIRSFIITPEDLVVRNINYPCSVATITHPFNTTNIGVSGCYESKLGKWIPIICNLIPLSNDSFEIEVIENSTYKVVINVETI